MQTGLNIILYIARAANLHWIHYKLFTWTVTHKHVIISYKDIIKKCFFLNHFHIDVVCSKVFALKTFFPDGLSKREVYYCWKKDLIKIHELWIIENIYFYDKSKTHFTVMFVFKTYSMVSVHFFFIYSLHYFLFKEQYPCLFIVQFLDIDARRKTDGQNCPSTVCYEKQWK